MAVTTGTATRTTTRHSAASTAPLTVRIVEGRLFLCAPTEELLAGPADEAGIDLAASRTVPVLLDDGSTGTWYGAPVVGSLRFVDWLVRSRPTVDVTVTAVAALIVEAVELTSGGELVPDLATDTTERTWSWRPAPGIESAGRIGKVWFPASEAVADGDPDEVLHGWFATAVADLATARLGPPPLASAAEEAKVHRWADQVTARASAGARLRFHITAPDDLDGHFLLLPRFEALTDPTVVLPPLGPDTADLLGTSPHDAVTLLACEWDIARRAWSDLPEKPADQLIISPGAVAALLEDGIGALDAAGITVHLPSALLPDSSLVRRVTITGRSSGLDAKTLALSGEVLVDGDPLTAEELEVLARARGELVAVRGRWLRIDEETRAATLAFTKRVAEGNQSTADVLELAATADEVDVEAVSGWVGRALAGEFKPTPAEKIKTPKTITATLRHYQEDGLAWLVWLEKNELGGILADDMGLGKTAQALAIIAYDIASKKKPTTPTLVVAPTSVVSNWLREAERFAPKLRVVLHHGSAREDPVGYIGTADVVVTSYGVMRRDEPLREIEWHRVVLDEAQAIKNPTTATTKAARKLKGTHKLVVTGTPVENHLGELWSLMSFANPGLLGTQAGFKNRYADYVGTAAGADALAALRKRIAPFVLRRHKADPGIADELPERILVRDDCTLTREQAALYQAVVEDMRSDIADATGMKRRGKVLAGITKLKQICNHPATITDDDGSSVLAGRSGKLDRLVELAQEIIEEGEAVVVFSQYATFLRRVAEHLRTELEVGVENLDGKMARAARDKAVARFSEDGGPPVLCVSLKAGGTGLNLVRGNHVIHFDRWWNPAVEDQASDRVWRIGQTRGVVVHTLVCPGTLEERIADLLDQKRSLAKAVVASSPEQLISELDDAALAALVELDADRGGSGVNAPGVNDPNSRTDAEPNAAAAPDPNLIRDPNLIHDPNAVSTGTPRKRRSRRRSRSGKKGPRPVEQAGAERQSPDEPAASEGAQRLAQSLQEAVLRHTSAAVLGRGTGYAKRNRVSELRVSAGRIRGRVRGSGDQRYRVELTVPQRPAPEQITKVRWSCDCPYVAEHRRGTCKHVVALALVAAKRIERTEAMHLRWLGQPAANAAEAAPAEADVLAERLLAAFTAQPMSVDEVLVRVVAIAPPPFDIPAPAK